LLRAADLRFSYPSSGGGAGTRAHVIDGVSLDVGRGALLGILGPNGSGKTTLLRLLSGAMRPDAGRVTLDGERIRDIPRSALAARVAVVPQETQLAFEYTALEIALMGRYPHLGAFEVEGPADLAAALSALDATGTKHLASRAFQTLSGGEKQRVIIASALAQLTVTKRPRVSTSGSTPEVVFLFLDEPTASLDLHYQVEMAALIGRLHDSQDVAIVLSTHDLHFAAAVCRDVLLLREGRVLAHGPVAEVLTSEALADLYDLSLETLRDWRKPGWPGSASPHP
jgi:iron complex transport system ATP-binding protein